MEARLALLLVTGWGLAWADPYPRQPVVDVEHYAFKLALSDTSEEIRGEARVDVRFASDGVTEFALDLARESGGRGMIVDAVESGGLRLAYLHEGHRLTIQVPRKERRQSFVVTYHGMPAAGLRIGPNGYGDRTFFSLNWPDQGRQWLPMVDHPYDKATSEFLITAPDTYQVVANGAHVETQDLGGGLRLTHWRQDVPMASWLNAIAVAPFSVRHFGAVRGVPLSNWVFEQDREKSIAALDEPTRAAMEFFTGYIGPYPYAKLANVQAAGFSGGMEHASVIFYGEKIFTRKEIPSLIAHEVAHQWFGNSVTERDWEDVWLSEGFASYFALLFTEHTTGREAFVSGLQRSRTLIRNLEKKQPDSPVIRETLTDMRQVITGLTYHKGAWTLHMLRHLVGDEAFRAGIRAFYEQYRGGNTTTADFQRIMEQKSGMALGSFFDQWLRRPGIPAITGTWRYEDGAVHIRLRQEQDGPVYHLPVEVEIDGTVTRIELRDREQEFAIPSKSAPHSLKIDPQTVLLATFEVQKTHDLQRP